MVQQFKWLGVTDASSKKDGTFFVEEGKNKISHIKADGTVLESGKEAQEALYSSLNEKNTAVKELNDFDPKILLCDYRNDANLIGAAANFTAQREGLVQ